MSMDNTHARSIQPQRGINESFCNLNVLQLQIAPNPQLIKMQEALHLPLCPSVKNCLSSKKDNPFACPSHSKCSKYGAILEFIA